jgi:hypothetical protein
MRAIYALGLGLALAGCATGPGLESRLAAFIGAPEADLVQHFGVPVRQINVNGVDYLAYQVRYQAQTTAAPTYWGGPFWGPGWGPYGGFGPVAQNVQVWSCEATFAVVQGKVQSFTLRGNDCK